MNWAGKAKTSLTFQGAAGPPFMVHGGDDLWGWVEDSNGEYALVNFGKTFVSANAKLDLMSTNQMQKNKLGTTFDLDGNAYMFNGEGRKFPLTRHNGLWKFNLRIANPKFDIYETDNYTAVQAAQADIDAVAVAKARQMTDDSDMSVPGAFAACRCCSTNMGGYKCAFQSAAQENNHRCHRKVHEKGYLQQ